MERLESKVDRLIEQQGEQNVTLTRLTVSVETHEQRSTNLESIVLPMKKKMDKAEGAMQLIGMICTGVGVVAAIVKVLEFIMK